jgi:ribosomal protein S18 acetylase RimI-like enzyme
VSVEPITLRPATDADTAFFAALYASTREAELAPTPFTPEQKDAFLAQQFAAQSAHYARVHGEAAFSVVLVDGERAGRLIVAERPDEVAIVDISLLPEYRGRGIGTRLLAPLLGRADATGRTVGIHVERFNPALRLYDRLGFRPVSDDGVYYKMVRATQGAAPVGADQPKTAS